MENQANYHTQADVEQAQKQAIAASIRWYAKVYAFCYQQAAKELADESPVAATQAAAAIFQATCKKHNL